MIDSERLSYFDKQRNCWSTELKYVTRVREIHLSADQASAGESDFRFGVLVVPANAPEYEKVFHAEAAQDRVDWMRAIHTNVCLIHPKLRMLPDTILEAMLSLIPNIYKS